MFVLAFFPEMDVPKLGNTGINLIYLVFTGVFRLQADSVYLGIQLFEVFEPKRRWFFSYLICDLT